MRESLRTRAKSCSPSQKIPARAKDASSSLVEIGFLSRKRKLKPNLRRIIKRLALPTNSANGTKRATIASKKRKDKISIRDSLRSEDASTASKWPAIARQITVNRIAATL
ncbi:hypothetical protein HHX47_DHR5000777, partial [Lentinula edodes]